LVYFSFVWGGLKQEKEKEKPKPVEFFPHISGVKKTIFYHNVGYCFVLGEGKVKREKERTHT
jgi:hypothetical protein